MPHSHSATTDPFDTLNDAQRSAVEHGLGDDPHPAGALLVIAGAGSGKTKTLAARVARLVMAGADPQRVLLLTFSRRAAAEMSRRAGGLLQQALGLPAGGTPPVLPWAGTFHGIGARLLRDHASRIGLSENFTIIDRSDAEDLMGLVRHECGFSATKKRFPLKGTCLAIYSRVVNSRATLREVLDDSHPWCAEWEAELKRLFGAYVAHKQSQQVLDYDDLLLYWQQTMAEPTLARLIGARFDHVLVDEYQDTNRLQADILLALKPDGRGLTVVGDDAQSIYSFRAAEVRNILDFPGQFTPPARVVTLERNYRSTRPILDACNAVMAQAAEQHAKRLWTDRSSSQRPLLVTVEDDAAQARWVADRVLEHREQGLQLKSQAVLFRTSHHSAALELELARRNIPFVKFGGLKFLEAAHIKDVLSVLRWAQNPRCRLAGFRVAQLVPGIGPASARRLLDAMDAAPDPVAAFTAFEPPHGARDEWRALNDLLDNLRSGSGSGNTGGTGGGTGTGHGAGHATPGHGRGDAPVPSAPSGIGSAAPATPKDTWPDELQQVNRWYLPQLERLHDDARVRQADLVQLARIAAGSSSRERFLTELTLDPPEATSDESGPPQLDEDYLILSTIHSAKGQEWQSVHVLNVVDGCIPADMSTGHARQVEEERRLLYVAMTRARQHLHLLVPQRFYVTQQGAFGDRHLYGSLTRFIPPAVAAAFDTVVPAPPATAGASGNRLDDHQGPDAGPPINLAARVRSTW